MSTAVATTDHADETRAPAVSARTIAKKQLRIATAGSVDDGKSTLIGRLLHDTKTIFEDQLDAVIRASRRYGDQEVNLALLTDGLRAEREQGITIDVAYRYFATPNRSFVLADTPGHVQYTRNMVTGASVSDVALVLIDARHGVVEQTRRHLGVAALLGVSHVVVSVNKMDLVDWSQATFDGIVAEVSRLLTDLGADLTIHTIPLSALQGDNVVERSVNTPWYSGPTLLDLLESIDVDEADVRVGARLAVQWTIRAGSDYRGYAGQLSGGPLKIGDEIVALPSGLRSTVSGLTRGGVEVERAEPGDAIAISLADHIDVGRGDVLSVGNASVVPSVGNELTLDVCWMTDETATPGRRVIVKHLTRSIPATIESVVHRLDPSTLVPGAADALGLNDLGRLTVRVATPIAADPYARLRATGHAVLIDEQTNATAAAATIRTIA